MSTDAETIARRAAEPGGDEYVVAVVSYARAELLPRATLALLERHGVEPERVTIFVANASERRAYERALHAASDDGRSPWAARLVVARPGVRAVRNYVTEHYAEGTRIFCLDDDITELWQCHYDEALYARRRAANANATRFAGHALRPLGELDAFVRRAFRECAESDRRLWGVYAVRNAYFCRPHDDARAAVVDGLYFCVGCCYGVVNDRHVNRVHVDEKDDYERTARYYVADGGVRRYNCVTISTRYYATPGGMQAGTRRRTAARVAADAATVRRAYAGLVHAAPSRAAHRDPADGTPYAQVRLRDKREGAARVFGAGHVPRRVRRVAPDDAS